jgi:hypothetical protein
MLDPLRPPPCRSKPHCCLCTTCPTVLALRTPWCQACDKRAASVTGSGCRCTSAALCWSLHIHHLLLTNVSHTAAAQVPQLAAQATHAQGCKPWTPCADPCFRIPCSGEKCALFGDSTASRWHKSNARQASADETLNGADVSPSACRTAS